MAIFWYKAIDTQGKSTRGLTDALNLIDLELRLKRMGLDLVKGGPQSKKHAGASATTIKRRDLIDFCFHLEQLTKARVPIVEGLVDLRDGVVNPRFREVISSLIEAIEGGQRLSEAMAGHPKIFNKVFCSLIRSGESTGKLHAVLKNLTETLKWQDEITSQTRRILIYPVIAATLILVTITVMMIVLVPQMALFLKNAGQALPLQTKLLLATSDIFVAYWYLLIMIPVLAVIAIQLLRYLNPNFQYRVDAIKLRLPIMGPVLRKIILARFANTFALIYSSGITILEALKTCEEVVGNKVIQQGLQKVGQQISEGQNLTSAFQTVQLFPPLVIRMIKVGESTSNLDEALLNVTYFYDREIKESIGRIQAVLGPALILILASILLWVALSVLGPIYDTISKIKP